MQGCHGDGVIMTLGDSMTIRITGSAAVHSSSRQVAGSSTGTSGITNIVSPSSAMVCSPEGTVVALTRPHSYGAGACGSLRQGLQHLRC